MKGNIVDLNEHRNGIDFFVNKDDRTVIGVRCDMCDLMLNDLDEDQFMSIQLSDSGVGISVTRKELISFITSTGLYDEITDMIDQGLIK